MKKFKPTGFMALLLITYFSYSQTVTWTGNGDNIYWNNADNWDLGIPGLTSDVVLPAGSNSSHSFNSLIVNSVTVEDGAVLEINRLLNVNTTFDIEPLAIVNWSSGFLDGPYILTNDGTINFNSSSNVRISGGATFNNNNQLNMNSIGAIVLFGANLNNNVTGVIDFTTDGGGIQKSNTAPYLLTNLGMIKKTGGTGGQNTDITVDFENSGVLEAHSGVLEIRNSDYNNFTSGTFNVSAGAKIELDNPGVITASGTFDGVIDGDLWWLSTITVPGTLTFDFTGTNMPSWQIGILNGGGTLINKSDLLISFSGYQNVISGNTTLQNDGRLIFDGTSRINLNDGTILNTTFGTIDFQDDGVGLNYTSGSIHLVINQGVIEKSGGGASDTLLKGTYINESGGSIKAVVGTIDFSNSTTILNNMQGAAIKGAATIILPNPPNFINDGTIAPGASPGILTLQGNYVSSSTTNATIELNGYTQGVDYDLLNIDGDADLDGGITVFMGFAATINDEFVVLTSSGSINTCNLPTTISANYNSTTYNFSVLCRNNNELVLRVDSILAINDVRFNSEIILSENPVSNQLILTNKNRHLINSISIVDLNGKLISIFNINYDNQSIVIPIFNLKSGVYFVKITSKNRLTTHKFIKL